MTFLHETDLVSGVFSLSAGVSFCACIVSSTSTWTVGHKMKIYAKNHSHQRWVCSPVENVSLYWNTLSRHQGSNLHTFLVVKHIPSCGRGYNIRIILINLLAILTNQRAPPVGEGRDCRRLQTSTPLIESSVTNRCTASYGCFPNALAVP